jgi:hypothetical protein
MSQTSSYLARHRQHLARLKRATYMRALTPKTEELEMSAYVEAG